MTEKERKQQTVQWIVTGVLLLAGLYNQLAIIKNWPHIELVDSEVTKYVTWLYELVMGVITFWYNQNVTGNAKISQLILNALNNNIVTPAQVEGLLNSETMKTIADYLVQGKVTLEQIDTLAMDDEVRGAVDAINNGTQVTIDIQED